jgi:hypothetical protein
LFKRAHRPILLDIYPKKDEKKIMPPIEPWEAPRAFIRKKASILSGAAYLAA